MDRTEPPDALPAVDPRLEPPPTRHDEPFRPQVHFSPATNWMNDPNGLIVVDGTAHLFYQHHPGGTLWGPMHWGHAVAPDLVRWEHRPIALAPDPELGMAFSGSAVALAAGDPAGLCAGDRCVVLVFTHHGGTSGGQKQSLALSDDGGRTFRLFPGNPVLESERPDFRDPKVFWHAPTARWGMVVAAGDRLELYTSPDLVAWERRSTFAPDGALGEGVWECPDLFPLADPSDPERTLWVLQADRSRGIGSPSDAVYWTGSFDGATFTPDDPAPRLVDAGPDFYAAQSWSGLPDGERTWIAWMSNWSYALLTPTGEWRGAMTVPRRVSLAATADGVALVQRPLAALETLRLGLVAAVDDEPLADARAFGVGPAGRTLDIEATFAPGDAAEVGLRVRVGPAEETVIGVDVADGRVFLDRTRSGEVAFAPAFAGVWEAALPEAPDGTVTLRVLVDRSSVEVFAQDGRVVLTARVFPSPDSTDVVAYAVGGAATLRRLRAHALGTIWPVAR